jgi:peptidyl-prolyl cis-trans isomerase D
MLQSLREQSGKWFIKILFVAIIASFMAWGIGDVIRSYSALRPIAKIGKHSISYEEFAHALQQQITRLQQATKGRISSDQLKQMGVHSRVLDKLINQAILEQELIRSNLSVSDALVRQQVHSVPQFQHNGSFDKRLFEELLRHNGISEKKFIEDIKQSLLIQQLISPLAKGFRLPKAYRDVIFQTLNEDHVFTVVLVPSSKIKLKKSASEEDLKTSYAQNKERYSVQEFRKVTIVFLDNKNLMKDIIVTEKELKEEYEKRISNYSVAEKRSVKSLTYPTKALAEDALSRLQKGRPIPAVVRDVKGGSFSDLGIVTKDRLPESVADTVFSLDVGQNSAVIETSFGSLIYQIDKIEPAYVQPLSEVKAQLEEEIRLQKAEDHIHQIKNNIEDSLAAGTNLSDVAKEHKLTIETISDLNVKGLDANNKPVLETLDKEAKKLLIEQVFNLNEGSESPITDANSNLSFIVRVEKATPAYIPEFEVVKAKVQEDWTNENKQKEAAETAYKITQEAKNLADLTRLANKYNLTLSSNYSINRLDAEQETAPDTKKRTKEKSIKDILPPDLLTKAFQLGLEQATFGTVKDGFAVVMLQKMTPFTPDTKKLETLNKVTDQMFEKDLTTLLIDSFRLNHSVSINQDTLNHVMNQD